METGNNTMVSSEVCVWNHQRLIVNAANYVLPSLPAKELMVSTCVWLWLGVR